MSESLAEQDSSGLIKLQQKPHTDLVVDWCLDMWLTRCGFTKALLDIIVLLTSTEILNHFQKFSLNFYPYICTNKLIIAFACSFKQNLPILYRICIQHHQNFCWYSKFWAIFGLSYVWMKQNSRKLNKQYTCYGADETRGMRIHLQGFYSETWSQNKQCSCNGKQVQHRQDKE